MAISSTWVMSLKVLLISTGVVSIALMMNFSVPLIIHFLVCQIPLICSTLISWLRPPYIYFIINGMIITIAVTSRFHRKFEDNHESDPLDESKHQSSDLHSCYTVSTPPDSILVDSPAVYQAEATEKTVVLNGDGLVAEDIERDGDFVISTSTLMSPQRITSSVIDPENLLSLEKSMISSSFGHRRKPLKASPEGRRSLRVVKPKRQETFETTWKAITDGRHVPLARHLRKSDTCENHRHEFNVDHSPTQIVLKSETFRDRTNYDPRPSPSVNSLAGSGKIRKESSLSQDELNRRVEAFIKKFNDEMRLQRQESVNQYMEMINRGAH